MKLIITGGGTGGHVYPGLAVARELLARGPEHEVVFVGAARGLEARLAPAAGLPFVALGVTGMVGRGPLAGLAAMLRLCAAFVKSLWIIARTRPDAALGVGGYASGPMGLAALAARVPLALAEQNAAPGLTNRWLGRFARRVFASWPESLPHFPAKAAMVTGNPVRAEFFTAARAKSGERVRVLIVGGSQGAGSINRAMAQAVEPLNALSGRLSITHQTGTRDLAAVRASYGAARFEWEAREFFDDMPQRLADADLVISRAGAGAVFEVCAAGRAAVFVPFPHAADDHQTKNAMALVSANAAMLIPGAEVSGARLAEVIRWAERNRDQLAAMGERAKSFARPRAAALIVDELLTMVKEAA